MERNYTSRLTTSKTWRRTLHIRVYICRVKLQMNFLFELALTITALELRLIVALTLYVSITFVPVIQLTVRALPAAMLFSGAYKNQGFLWELYTDLRFRPHIRTTVNRDSTGIWEEFIQHGLENRFNVALKVTSKWKWWTKSKAFNDQNKQNLIGTTHFTRKLNVAEYGAIRIMKNNKL